MQQQCGLNGCCEAGEECVSGYQCLPACANERCGDNLATCCEPNQECLAGSLCVSDCGPTQSVCGAFFELCCPPQ